MSIAEDIEPYLDYIVEEIADMSIFDRERVKILLTLWFSSTIEQVYSLRAETLAGQATNNERDIRYGALAPRDKEFLNKQNMLIKERRKEANRISSMGKDIYEFVLLRKAINNLYGAGTAAQLLEDIRSGKIPTYDFNPIKKKA